jgi:two-component system chemotaxis sensor kinase CheA
LAQRANVVSGVRERALGETQVSAVPPAGDRHAVLLFTSQEGVRMAIPLSMVARLEEFPRSAIERVGPQEVVQYRDEIMPLVHVSRALRRRRTSRSDLAARRRRTSLANRNEPATVQVVVHSGTGQRVGLVVDNIVDIVEEALVARSPASRPGVLFNAVIQGRATEVVDVESIIHSADPVFVDQPQPMSVEA